MLDRTRLLAGVGHSSQRGRISSVVYGCYGIQFVDPVRGARLRTTIPSLYPTPALLHFDPFLQYYVDYGPAPAVSELPLGC